MAVHDPMRFFRPCGKAELLDALGQKISGFGVTAPLWRDRTEAGDLRHALGAMRRPLWRFVGAFPKGTEPLGGTLFSGGAAYRVLDVRPLRLGARELGVRMLLERSDADDSE